MNRHADFDISHLQLEASQATPTQLRSMDDANDFVVTQSYQVQGLTDGCYDAVLGEIEVQTVLLGQALNEGIAWSDVMDTSGDLYAIYEDMFAGSDSTMLDAGFEDAVGDDATCQGLTYVPSDDMLDYNWGPAALRILLLSANTGYVVVGVSNDDPQAPARGEKLLDMGFTCVNGGPFYYLNLAMKLPEMPMELNLPGIQALKGYQKAA